MIDLQSVGLAPRAGESNSYLFVQQPGVSARELVHRACFIALKYNVPITLFLDQPAKTSAVVWPGESIQDIWPLLYPADAS